MFRHILAQLTARQDLSAAQIQAVIQAVADNQLSDAQLAGFLLALLNKGVSTAEITAIVTAMRAQAIRISPRVAEPLLDTCGTGGGLSTFNISTASAFVCAAAGIPVAKHGSRSLSSHCGSADVLEALGVAIDLPPEAVCRQIEQIGLGFLHAPNFHPVMRRLLPVEASLGIKTIFYTLIGPLINPAGASRHVLGVYRADLLELTREVLPALDYQDVLLVHGIDGIDEIALTGPSRICQFRHGELQQYQISPEQFGLRSCTLDEIRSDVPLVSAELMRQLFAGTIKGARRDAVLFNSAGALMLCGRAADFTEGIALAASLLDGGKAQAKLQLLIESSQDFARAVHQHRPVPVASTIKPVEESSDLSAVFLALQRSEQNKRARLQTLIETLPDLIWLTDLQGLLLNCNSRFERFAGLAESQLKGLALPDFLPADLAGQLTQSAQTALQQQRAVLTQQWICYQGETEQQFVDVIQTPFINQDGSIDGVMAIARDVTAFKRTEQELLRHRDQLEFMVEARTAQLTDVIAQLRQTQLQLVEAEKLSALGAIVAGLSHELNTPLGNILTVSSALDTELQRLQQELAQGRLSKSGLQDFLRHNQEMLALQLKAAQRCASLIGDFKQLSADKIAEQRGHFDAVQLLQSCITREQSALTNADIQLIVECPNSLVCDSYPDTMKKIIGHLLHNVVIHAFPANHPQLRQLELRLERHADALELSCRDNGIGLSATALTRVFHPFFTLDMSKGAGIGLPLCKRLALSVLGGDLEVSANAGAGCCFVLKMPLVAPGYRSVPADLAQSTGL